MQSRTLIGGQQWEEMQGFTFCLPRKDGRLFFYFEGPPPQVDLLIASVALKEPKVERSTSGEDINIIQNPKFIDGGKQWARNMCRAEFNSSLGYAKTTNRVERSSGIEQDIGARLRAELVYELNVEVRVSGDNETDVYATLRIRRRNESRCKVIIARAPATNEEWVKLQGKFFLPYAPLTAVIRLEGSPPGTDIFVTGLRVCGHQAPSDLDPQVYKDKITHAARVDSLQWSKLFETLYITGSLVGLGAGASSIVQNVQNIRLGRGG
ncbi:hypothetical protein RJ639_018447 [Escallonia herrerae]|uniref:CBM-cenC domain-containing protein n=1 Tax=Escallonia herrerae TaxID=1293975 RepID=A0AA89AJ93_9ASTE|nr:hypothetical protein RJ639_025138 [Escallonia herrerae]KAK3003256.1 hypothetical protein RJ639_018447 [Escallonia herrerae]